MSLRSMLVAMLGVAIAGGSALGAREYLSRLNAAEAAVDESQSLVTVVVAARDIAFGQAIQPQMLQTMKWPIEALPPGAVTSIATLVPPAGDEPRRATMRMAQGEMILASKVSEFGEKVTIVQSLRPDTRAMAIKVDAETAVGGLVTPGDSVDIVMTQGRDETLTATTILQNIRVVGVDQDTDTQTDTPEVARTVTVEVTPDQGQKLALAQKAGALSLTLRTLDAAAFQPLEQVRLSDLIPEEKAEPVVTIAAAVPAPVVEAPKKSTIRVRRGIDLTVEDLN